MDWFERITGFKELGYAETKAALSVVDGKLRSRHSERESVVGELETPSLSELRERAAPIIAEGNGELRVSSLQGDVRLPSPLHAVGAREAGDEGADERACSDEAAGGVTQEHDDNEMTRRGVPATGQHDRQRARCAKGRRDVSDPNYGDSLCGPSPLGR